MYMIYVYDIYGICNLRVVRVMIIGIWIYSVVCDIREYQGESDGI